MKIGDIITVRWDTIPSLFNVVVKRFNQEDDSITVVDVNGTSHRIKNYSVITIEKSL